MMVSKYFMIDARRLWFYCEFIGIDRVGLRAYFGATGYHIYLTLAL
jgi:hypothetical protein